MIRLDQNVPRISMKVANQYMQLDTVVIRAHPLTGQQNNVCGDSYTSIGTKTSSSYYLRDSSSPSQQIDTACQT